MSTKDKDNSNKLKALEMAISQIEKTLEKVLSCALVKTALWKGYRSSLQARSLLTSQQA